MYIRPISQADVNKLLTTYYLRQKEKAAKAEPEKPKSIDPIWDKYTADADKLLKRYNAKYDPSMFTKLAKDTYEETGKIIPITFVVAQLQLETGLGKTNFNNPANVLVYDSGAKRKFDSPEQSLKLYYGTLAKEYLNDKTVDDLVKQSATVTNATLNREDGKYYDALGNEVKPEYSSIGTFVNKEGKRYASNPNYEKELGGIYRNLSKYLQTKTFKHGGSLFNKIADGVYHSRKHDIKRLSGLITKKGIPVIEELGKEIVQHAEVEKNELILRKEATAKIEEYRDSYRREKNDDILYKLGVYFANELQNNTIDSKDKLL